MTEPRALTGVDTAYFASGCFWGTEYFLKRQPGVLSTRVGYIGGHVDHPTYQQVCSGSSGHAEAVEVTFDPAQTNFETLARIFFETHDPTQEDRQGPDVGTQYRSAIFYTDENQRTVSERLVGLLVDKGLDIATEITKATTFWPAEAYHQDYYGQTGRMPYCHAYTQRF
jgi:peptide methionine sulfoxide reductase msrA/msrB